MAVSAAKQHTDKAADARLRTMLTKAGRKTTDVDKLDLSSRRKRLAVLGVDESTYRASGGTLED